MPFAANRIPHMANRVEQLNVLFKVAFTCYRTDTDKSQMNLRTLIILSKYAKRKGKLSMAALRRSLGGTQTQDFMFPWLRMASVSVLHFMTERQIWHSTYIQISSLSVNLMFTHYKFNIPYARHHNLLLLTNRSWILTVYKDRISEKNSL